jgi:hypothetical protein
VTGLPPADGQLVGEQLMRMAQARQINNIHYLDPEEVFEEVERNPEHPLRKVFDWNDQSAARTQRIDYTRRLITTVRVIVAHVKAGPRITEPLFVTAKAPVVQPGSPALRRSHILSNDMLANDPAFASVVSRYTRQMLNELNKLEHLARSRPLPAEVQQLITDVRAAANAHGFV